MPAVALGPNPARGRTITEQFHTFDAHNPHVYSALERLAARRLAASATRVGVKDLFEDLRREGVVGLNNNFTALYARRLVDDHPRWAGAFELRRRRAA
ncbi:hypothetical protein [Streptomyces sp. NPDC047999]|uniref:hypothetical protein n=1 Tax=Streptomyces sp. NPDC047999 TaxID=3365497 RepID=UPI003718D43C